MPDILSDESSDTDSIEFEISYESSDIDSVELKVDLAFESSDTDSKSIINSDLILLVIITSSIIPEILVRPDEDSSSWRGKALHLC
ncbi:9834_t:CDS:2 [Funneliformis caledonium]|uniref:9834_t:CDS:1 n=1 Tax=Funneliformis caledonium TaxID=1117310 RepID=A0A9N9FEX3_9GLOM|nr:9834_t:CDS:2 [Funneliformis caledonium]